MIVILGLESSCDDSAAALVTSDRRILAQAVVGQNSAHQPYGGVVPEIAARAHVEILPGLIERVLDEAKLSIRDVDAVAATAGPGLIGGVMVALLAGKGLALAAGKPLLAVNHLEGHALSPRLADPDLDFPYLAAARFGRPLPAARSARRGRLSAPRDDHRRCRGRSVRQGREAARPALSRRTGDRGAGEDRRSQRPSRCRARWSDRASRISPSPASRARCSARSRSGDFAPRTLPRASSRRSSTASSTAPRLALGKSDAPALVVAGGVAANQAIRARACRTRDSARAAASASRRLAVHRQCGDDRLGRRRAACAGRCDALDVPARARWPLDESAEKVRGAGVKA